MNNPIRKRAPLSPATANRPLPHPVPKSPAAKSRTRPDSGDRLSPPSKTAKVSRSRKGDRPLERTPGNGLSAMAAITGSTTLFFCGAWLSVRLIVDPASINWVQSWLPAASQVPIANKEAPQTLQAITDQIREAGLIPASTLSLDSEPQTLNPTPTKAQQQLLMPVMTEIPCSGTPKATATPCQALAELRVYRPVFNPNNPSDPQPYYQLLNKLEVTGPDPSALVPTLTDSEAAALSLGPQPLTRLDPFENAPEPGNWFNLHSDRTFGNRQIAYGKIIHYNPETFHLSEMTDWVSPEGHLPQWQEISGGGDPELVIDRSIGMEPQFQIYQIKPIQFFLNPIGLEEISLVEPILTSRAYRDALLLARSQLWSAAWELMASLKQDSSSSSWPPAAQAQLDVIRYHAQITQTQANATGMEPPQQILTALIDGNWKKALEVYELQLKLGDEMGSLLTDEKFALWNRIETAVKVNPAQADAKAWGALVLAARYNDSEAVAWLEEQAQNTAQLRDRIYNLLDARANASTYAEKLKTHKSQIIGTASMLSQVNPQDWLRPQGSPPLELQSGQVWYQVQVSGFNDSRSWRQAPFKDINLPKSALSNHLWKELGLHNDPQIQIGVWMPNGEQKTTLGTVKGLRLVGGDLLLLTTSDAIPTPEIGSGVSKPLSLTAGALQWRSPAPQTLKQLHWDDPEWVEIVLPSLWQELQTTGQVPQGAVPSTEQMLTQLGGWFVQSTDLTGNNLSEAVITLRSDALVPSPGFSHAAYRTRTLIFDDQGALIYSELSTADSQAIAGIADLPIGGLPVLVVEGSNGYNLQRWSSDRQRFEF
ncbi:tetratricopeptide repeat protein [Laspinema olomoucense]|uniref:tetratricopeptide repeat protein n=1 Tax=Laspinema olomoucense TaxID=3231600 RepID=UPI0021BA662F|nr:hypothetical protein [Laspinema sp. D3a]MCT7987289.1 hypothetical protein [Laspinema sp. D3a]